MLPPLGEEPSAATLLDLCPTTASTAPITMQMDALHCGYPHVSAGMGGGVPITPPATPTQDISRTPTFSSCGDSGFSQHEYAQHDFADQKYSHPEYTNNNTEYTNNNTEYPSSAYTPTHSLSPPESPMVTPKTTPTHTPAHTPLSSTPSKGGSKSRTRKNSFVYDVRLTDEQFLFFVPDFVSFPPGLYVCVCACVFQ